MSELHIINKQAFICVSCIIVTWDVCSYYPWSIWKHLKTGTPIHWLNRWSRNTSTKFWQLCEISTWMYYSKCFSFGNHTLLELPSLENRRAFFNARWPQQLLQWRKGVEANWAFTVNEQIKRQKVEAQVCEECVKRK